MLRPELYKLTHHRTPWVILAGITLLTIVAPVYFIFRAPETGADYLLTTNGVLGLAVALLAPVFGAWAMGHEYRQSTLKRVVALNGRRDGLLAVKGLIAVAGSAVGTLIAAGAGVGVSALAASIHGQSLDFTDFGRTLGSAVFIAAIVTAIAYLLSVVLRSDTYAMMGTIGVMTVFGPLLAFIPRIGEYLPPTALATVAEWISTPGISLADGVLWKSALSLAATLGVGLIAARQLFSFRDL